MPKQKWTLVTGASGFIGTRLVRRLLDDGQRVRAFVRPGSDLSAFADLPPDRIELAFGDVTVEHTLFRALGDCDRIFHVASQHCCSGLPRNLVTRTAIDGTRAVLDAARRRRVDKIVVTSCAVTLGVARRAEAMDEAHEFNLSDPPEYVEAKREAENVALDAAAELPVVVVLPAVVVGPGDRGTAPAGRAIVRYLTRSPLFRVPVADGGVSIVDVDDVVRGHVLAMERGKIGERYVLGGENLTQEQVVETLSELTGLAPPVKRGVSSLVLASRFARLGSRWSGRAPVFGADILRQYADSFVWVGSDKAKSELGYEFRPARQALMRAVQWFLERGFVANRAARRVRLELGAA